ncbi:MAG: beta-ketoacyl-[acyl-carrier-protein] synthase family protein [Terrimicrobiaceae bacterium]|nr:beta-ketoacyl-[acyl-carrier-protein] synthase family protein [Terrimicrobiaceae bacterium]
MSDPRRRAVITGLGPITCIGTGRKALWAGLLAEKSGIGPLTYFDTAQLHARCAGEIHDFDPKKWFPPQRLKRLDRYAQFAVAAAHLALQDAGLTYSPDSPTTRIGVSYGTALGGVANAESEYAPFLAGGPKAVKHTLALQVFGGSAHSNIAIEFGLQGIGTTNSNSCASGPIAVGEAMRYIRDGMADVVIAGAAESPLSPLTYSAFDLIRTMSRREPPTACCPFDVRRDGFVMGEGAAALIVEEYEHAKRRGARIYAEVLGYSLSNDAHHMTSPHPTGDPAIRTMRETLADARLNPADIDYINAHASSTRVNDSSESRCIHAALGHHARRVPVSGTKAYTAHPLGATGAIELAICCLAMEHGWIPPTLHSENQDPECDLDIVPNHGREMKLRRVLSNSFGFGGINACIAIGAV